MKKILIFCALFVLWCSVLPASAKTTSAGKDELKRAIRVTPKAPTFTVSERHSELSRRRNKVAALLKENSMLILFSAAPRIYTNDVDYHYRQENNLYYLTALKQKNATLIMMKKDGKIREILFIPKRNPRTETWNGRMYSNEDATRLSGLKTIINAGEERAFLESVKSRKPFTSKDGNFTNSFIPQNIYLLQGRDRRESGREIEFAKALREKKTASGEGAAVRNAMPIFAKLRLKKSSYEIELMQHAVDITSEAMMRSMGMVGRANWEYEVQAEVEYTFRRRNADFWGYPSIIGCGSNATTLHYIESQGKVKKGELILMDVGAEYDHYTADITRTFPVNGKFTKEQAEIYQIVYDAQEAAAAQLKPGVTIGPASAAARKVIVDGLFKLGLITDKKSNQYRFWYMHGWGHWIGMNVHDVGNYGSSLKEGMITSNEPGIYIRADALDYIRDTPENREFLAKVRPAFEKYKNIGVRIEDDMLITATGVKWMSKHLPRSITDIEDFMVRASREMARNALLVQQDRPTYAVRSKYPFGLDGKNFWRREVSNAH